MTKRSRSNKVLRYGVGGIDFSGFENITDIFLSSVSSAADRIFLRIKRGGKFYSYTYLETLERVRRIGAYLFSKGFNPGDRAAVVGENCPEWVFSYLGILWAGGVVVPLDFRAKLAEWKHLMRHSGCRFAFSTPASAQDLKDSRDSFPTLEDVVAFRGEEFRPTLDTICSLSVKVREPAKRGREDMAAILYTSGTTGVSRGVVLTHGNILSNLEQVLSVLDVDQDDRFFSILPMHHSFEATCGFLLPMVERAAITFATSLKSKELIDDFRELRPTVLLAVPLLLEKMYQGFLKSVKKSSPLKRGFLKGLMALSLMCDFVSNGRGSKILLSKVREAMGLERLRYLVSGGAALPRELSRAYERLGFPILQGYGLTETSPVVSVNLPGRRRNESVGLPLPGIRVKIVDPDPQGIGEIVLSGPNVMKGYYKNEHATDEAIRDGWLHTGDLGRIDRDGFLYVTGRKKSLIVTRGGKNISPEEIEEELLKSPFIKEVLVMARIHPRTRNEEIHAIIHPDFENLDQYVLEKGIRLDERHLNELIHRHIERVNSILPTYKRVRSFSIREEEFPKTTTQKIKRYLFEQGGIEISERGGPAADQRGRVK